MKEDQGVASRDQDARPQPGTTGTAIPSEVAQTRDGYPSGRHMIDAYRMMAMAARTSGGKHQKDIAEVYDCAAKCIENEALRADRAEAALAEARA